MQVRHPTVLWRGDASRRTIALTFDDGPHPKDTPRVLDVLAIHNVRATFFLIGKYVEQYPHLVKQIHQSGHQLGIHCYRHLPFLIENPSTLCTQLDRTRNVIADACGINPESIRDLRPPYGAFTKRTLSMLEAWSYRLVMWNNIPPHWMQPLGWTIKQILGGAIPGSIIVLHDGHGHGTKVAQIVNIIVPQLKAMDFEFITVEQMRSKQSNSNQKENP
jgi:peptidoglycan/xylan/chitin deacetylase (PgdA/CDA1 family)